LATRQPRHSFLLRASGVAIAVVGAYFLSQA